MKKVFLLTAMLAMVLPTFGQKLNSIYSSGYPFSVSSKKCGAYGPWLIRLKVPGFTDIGIHGTCFPNSIGTRCSEGCNRIHNTDPTKLKSYIHVGTMCTILPDSP